MKRLLLCFWLTGMMLGHGSAASKTRQQTSTIDSLRQALRKTNNDAEKITLLTEMARSVPHADSTQAISYWNQAVAIAKQTTDQLDEAKTYLNIGSWHYDHYRTDEAYRYNVLAQQIVSQDTSKEAQILLAKSRINMANISWQRNRVEEALQGYLNVLPLLSRVADTASLALVNTNIAILFSNQKQYEKSNHYFLESIHQYQHLLPLYHKETADLYLMLSMNILDTETADKKRGTNYLDSAFVHLQHIDKQDRTWADYYSMRGRYQLTADELKAAESSFRQGLTIARHYNDTYTSSDILLYLSELYSRLGAFEKTRPLLDELLAISKTNNSGPYQLKALRALSRMEYQLKRPEEAYRYLNAYINLSDSLHYHEVTTKLHEMEEKYKLAEARNELLALQRENEKKDFSLERNRLYIGLLIGVSIPLLISCILVFLFYRNKKKLLAQQQNIYAIDMERIEHLHRNSLLSALLEGQEKERERLARDLHDGLGGILSTIKMNLSRISSTLPKQTAQRQELRDVAHHLDNAVEELRGIAHSMMPSMLVNYGLSEALREYCDRLQHSGIPIFFQSFRYDNSMEQPRQMLLYRIAQELINNGIKHAQATEILVQLQQNDTAIILTVEDDGKGFNRTKSYSGAGLRNVAMRVDLLNGVLDIRSDLGIGTTFTIECPVKVDNTLFPDQPVLHR